MNVRYAFSVALALVCASIITPIHGEATASRKPRATLKTSYVISQLWKLRSLIAKKQENLDSNESMAKRAIKNDQINFEIIHFYENFTTQLTLIRESQPELYQTAQECLEELSEVLDNTMQSSLKSRI